MATASAISTGFAKNGPAESCVKYRNKLRMNLEIAETARRLFPVKTALQLVDITGYPPRTVEAWLTGKVKIPSDALAMLIRSEWGVDFLGAVMGDACPSWWRKTLSYFAALDAMSLQRRARRKLKEAIDADRDTTAAIARADALLVHDQEFYGTHAAALRSVARVPGRAMAPKRGRS